MYMKSLKFLNKIKSISLVIEQYKELVFLPFLYRKCPNDNQMSKWKNSYFV